MAENRKARSLHMAKIKGRGNISTEISLAKQLRLNRIKGWRRHYKIAGKPDFVFPKRKVAVFADGCFWHCCPRCYRQPKSNIQFWRQKIQANVARDIAITKTLKSKGWTVIRIWECQIKRMPDVTRRIRNAL